MKTDKELDIECRKGVWDQVCDQVFILLVDRLIDQGAFQVSKMRNRIETQVGSQVRDQVNNNL
jgi:hypothetical protein